MKKTRFKGASIRRFYLLLAVLVFLLPCFFKGQNDGGRYGTNTLTANAASGDVIEIQRYEVDMTVRTDRRIEVKEKITVEFLARGLTMFYRSLPMKGARYENIVATCEGNEGFFYEVASNPDVEGYLDINCVGNADRGKVWTYDISYVMEQGVKSSSDGMTIDVVGFGWTVPLHNVTAVIRFPEIPTFYDVHTDIFGSTTANNVQEEPLEEGKALRLKADKLDLAYSDAYSETVAGGLTVEFNLPEGTLKGYTVSRMFTEDIWKIFLGGAAAVGLAAVLLIFTRKKQEIVTVVNIKAPDDMDPMKMGKLVDGTVDNEDVTSMIYYFANKGYLRIDFTDENDPTLISMVNELPEGAPVYQKTVFNGLFANAHSFSSETQAVSGLLAVRVSELEGKFYEASQTAIKQVPGIPMYEHKSMLGYFGGAAIAIILAVLAPLLMSFRIGGNYAYLLGVVLALPVFAIVVIGYIKENYRYKWKPKKRNAFTFVQLLIAVVGSVIFAFWFAEYIMTEYEKLLLCAFVFVAVFITQNALSRTETYMETLGDILGFKEFIVVTEEDKIKVMLEENPELYYKVLPYAQVLGVTDEWEKKFEKILVAPPFWYTGSDLTVFDCYIIHRCLSRSVISAMTRAAMAKGGSYVGRSGGGGSFGGFGGGGFGGGGGGAR